MRSDKSLLLFLAFFFWLGAYFGMFMSEANIQYDCQKDGVWVLTGHFWKQGIKYTCAQVPTHAKGEMP
jgi:hypothetical protein